MRRHQDWLKQASRDLRHAENSVSQGDFEWAAFAAHQAAEKAVRALLQYHGIDAWGHSVYFLLRGLSQQVGIPQELEDLAKALDRHYLAPRYPDAFPEGAPSDYYTKTTAEEAIEGAREVLAFVRGQIPNA